MAKRNDYLSHFDFRARTEKIWLGSAILARNVILTGIRIMNVKVTRILGRKLLLSFRAVRSHFA